MKSINAEKEKGLKTIYGNSSVIISAPHSTMHERNGSIRASETRTGELVRKICKETSAFGIYKSKPELNDANWDKKCKYKKEIIDIVNDNNIKSLIDIHGMAAYRKQDICIGINKGKNINNQYDLLDSIINVFNKYGFNSVSIDNPFSAANPYCVSTYIAQRSNILTFQIEINRKYRSAKYKEFCKYTKLLKAMVDVVKLLENEKNFKA